MAIDRVNFYLQQLVTETDMDDVFDDVEAAVKSLALDAHQKQALLTDAHTMLDFGGIVEGLVVTDIGGEAVQVSIGAARDYLGRRIRLTSNASVLYTHTGATPEGGITSAVGNGAAIAGATGQRIIASLFLVFDQHLSNQKLDGSGATVYYNIDQSFHFELEVGAYGLPPGSRAPLTNDKVLLTDLVLLDTAGTLSVVAICNTNEDWDGLGAGYNAYVGRRSDWLSFDYATDFPRFSDANVARRYGSSREALYGLIADLQRSSASPPGTSFIGAPAVSGSVGNTQNAALSLTAGPLTTQISSILTSLNNKVSRGGDTIQPAATGSTGLVIDATGMTTSQRILSIKGNFPNIAAARSILQMRQQGLIVPGRAFMDHFLYKPTGPGGAWDPATDSPYWDTMVGGAPGGSFTLESIQGGVLNITSGAADGTYRGIQYGGTNVTNGFMGGWNIGDLSLNGMAVMAARFCINTALTDADIHFGFIDVANSAVAEVIVNGTAGTMYSHVLDSAGTGANGSGSGAGNTNIATALSHSTWYFIGLSAAADRATVFDAGGIGTASATAIISGGTGSFGNGPFAPFFYVGSIAGGGDAAVSVYLDWIGAFDGNAEVQTAAP